MSTYKERTQHLLEAQRAELMKFRGSAKVRGVADILSSAIETVESKIRSLEADGVKYRNIGTNHWDWCQDGKKVTITLYISNVDKEKMEKNILSDSLDIKFHDVEVEGKHLRFVGRKLLKEIVPGESTVEVKEHFVEIVLPKCSEGDEWSDLFIKKDKESIGTSKEETWHEDQAGIFVISWMKGHNWVDYIHMGFLVLVVYFTSFRFDNFLVLN